MPIERLLAIAVVFIAIGVVWGAVDGQWAQVGTGLVAIAAAVGVLVWRRGQA